MPTPALQHATPRGFEELRGVLIELVEEGSALGLTAAELFLQFGDRACADGIGRRELRDGLASLSVHLTDAEVDTLLAGAGCTGKARDEQSPEGSGLLTLEKFSAVVEKPIASPPTVAAGTAAAASAALDTQQPSPGAEIGEHTPLNRDDGKNRSAAADDDDGCVTPDSLAPRMSLSELLVDIREAGGDGDGDGDGPGTSSSAAAHVEAFGRVAANVQAVLATAISRSGTGHGASAAGAETGDGGGSGGGGGGGGFGRHSQHTSSVSGDRIQQRDTDTANIRSPRSSKTPASSGSTTHTSAARSRAGPEQDPAAVETPPSARVSTAASRSGPVPRTGAITPPLGSARSPSEPLHPTRASRERLEAALEGLDLKERLRPTASVGGSAQGGGGSGDEDDEDGGVHGTRSPHRSAGPCLPGGGRSGLSPRRLASVDVGGGPGTSGGRRVSAIRARMVAGVDERGARVRRPSGRASGRAGAGAGAGGEQRRRLGEVVDLAAAERIDLAAYDGGSEEAPEVIGRLRARVAELELSEQVSSSLFFLHNKSKRTPGRFR